MLFAAYSRTNSKIKSTMLNTNCEFLRPEIMDVLRLFGEEEGEFNHSFVREGNKFINSIERGDTSRVFCDE